MSSKAFLFSIGCVLAWVVLLPLVVLGGCVALVAYAVFAEVGTLVTGKSASMDPRAAREMARRVCVDAIA